MRYGACIKEKEKDCGLGPTNASRKGNVKKWSILLACLFDLPYQTFGIRML
jgi:hypothetical protein